MLGEGRAPLTLVLFDIMHIDGTSTVSFPIEERKRRLGELELNEPSWRTASYSLGNGPALLAASREQRLEGLVAKRLGSKYKPGRRSPDWIKVKNFDRREVVIGGWIAHRDGTYGVLVGDLEGNVLAFAGVVDIGIGPQLIVALQTIEQRESPFAPTRLPRLARFVEPRLVAEVQYLAGSDALRHAVFRSVRVRDL
jgi:bifunctional non-homologous end joining protein LigD